MKIAVLASPNGWHFRDLCRAAASFPGVQLAAASFSQLATSVDVTASQVRSGTMLLNEFDVVLARAMPSGSLQQIVFRMDAVQELEREGVTVVNSAKTIEASVDKYLSLCLMRRAGVPVPVTAGFQTFVAAEAFVDKYAPVVLKPIFGSEGRGLQKFADTNQFRQYLQEREVTAEETTAAVTLGGVYYLQEFVPHQYDVRILQVGDELFGMKRENPDSWVSNASRGARCHPYAIPPAEQDLARRAAAAVGGQLIGVDLIHGANGQATIVEVNASPGWKAISTTLRADIAAAIIRLLIRLAG